VYKANKKFIDALKLVRQKRGGDNKAKGHDFFRPSDIYIVHAVPRIMKFRVESRCYEIHALQSTQEERVGDINFRTEASAVIIFDLPTSLDDALERVFEWQQFFVQMAMEPMDLEALSTWGERSWKSPRQDVYLPYLRTWPEIDQARHRLHPADVPFNIWHDRHHLRNAMQNWLLNGSSRALFRGSLNRVIKIQAKHSDLSDLVCICAGLETLPELSQGQEISSELIEVMGHAAFYSIKNKENTINIERIKGVLSNLGCPSLSNRLKTLALIVQSVVPLGVSKTIIKEIPRLRNISAHGGSFADRYIPMVSPVVEGLASMCAIFVSAR
jgi:hypothetical protein